MGTSGAYGGSPGWKDVRDQTQEWLSGGAIGGGGTSALAKIISGLGARLDSASAGGSVTREGRSVDLASEVGARLLGGAHDVRTGTTATLGELGLDLGELAGLNWYQQAQRILDAAIGPRGDVQESELRQANASVVVWALTEEVEPTSAELANRWVVEYVWEVWVTETGVILEQHSAEGNDRVRAEQEMREALEATVSGRALPEGRPLTTTDFAAAIDSALGSLRRISGNVA